MILCPHPEGDYRISQWFGDRPRYYKKYGHRGHNGIDFAPKNQAMKIIYAPHEGYVTTHMTNSGYGYYVEILSEPFNKDGHRRKSDLAHLASFLVHDGQYVAMGDPVAVMGGGRGQKGAGDSTGRHTHWTYKLTDWEGNTLNKDNGFNGSLDVAPYVVRWIPGSLR